MPLLGFDIEISNIFELKPHEDLDKHAPFNISVAATHVDRGERLVWLSMGKNGKPLRDMTPENAEELLQYLRKQSTGHSLVAWNGLSFDLRWIGHVAGDLKTARRVALKMYDPMFQFFKIKGFPVSLAKVGEAMGIATKKSMSAADAPKLWCAGKHDEVCGYVQGDARMTVEIAAAIKRHREIAWVTQRGTRSAVPIGRLRTVEECLADPMPDQSWMDGPIPEEKFAGWLDS